MNLAGVFSPIPTPFDDRDRVDTARLKAALAKWSAKPLTGFVVLGSNGEAALMDDFECDQAIVAARGPPKAATRPPKRAGKRGAAPVLVRPQDFSKTKSPTAFSSRHYTAVADASPVPVLLYNFTAVTGVNLLPAAVARLAPHPNIAGMKESGGDLAQISEVIANTPDDFQIVSGSLATFYVSLCVGCVGGILAPAVVVA